jgi:hypothetical protein
VLAGACIARTGLNRKTVLATLTVILAAEAPDLKAELDAMLSVPSAAELGRVQCAAE